MKSILLIGLGRFGRHIAEELNKLGHEVMAVDENEDRVNAVLSIVTNAQIGDSTNAEFLEALGVRNFDVCIVAISGNFQSSLETTSLLKELGAKMVVSRAERDVQAKFLLRNVRMRCFTRKSSWPSGRPSATGPTMCWIISSWTTTTPFWKYLCRPRGSERKVLRPETAKSAVPFSNEPLPLQTIRYESTGSESHLPIQ